MCVYCFAFLRLPFPSYWGAHLWVSSFPSASRSFCTNLCSVVRLQLAAFLFDAKVPQDYGVDRDNYSDACSISRAVERAREFACRGCGHTHDKPWPAMHAPYAPPTAAVDK